MAKRPSHAFLCRADEYHGDFMTFFQFIALLSPLHPLAPAAKKLQRGLRLARYSVTVYFVHT
jgi:hypothetical protein